MRHYTLCLNSAPPRPAHGVTPAQADYCPEILSIGSSKRPGSVGLLRFRPQGNRYSDRRPRHSRSSSPRRWGSKRAAKNAQFVVVCLGSRLRGNDGVGDDDASRFTASRFPGQSCAKAATQPSIRKRNLRFGKWPVPCTRSYWQHLQPETRDVLDLRHHHCHVRRIMGPLGLLELQPITVI